MEDLFGIKRLLTDSFNLYDVTWNWGLSSFAKATNDEANLVKLCEGEALLGRSHAKASPGRREVALLRLLVYRLYKG